MLTPEGRAKILDFGLAKSAHVSRSTNGTLAAGVTTPGLIMGTPGYMAPEQISGKPADPRSDIFALGVILYEMLSGKRAFNGDSTVELINANLKSDPAELPSSVPSPHQRIVHRCLEKDPSRRFQSAADVGFALLAVSDAGMSLPPVIPRRGIWLKWIAAAAAVAILVAAVAYWAAGTRPQPHRPLRLSLLPPHTTSFVANDFAISPDGQRLAFVAGGLDGKTNLWIRSLAASTAQQLTGTENAMHPFWSADSRQIGFFAELKLKTIDPAVELFRSYVSLRRFLARHGMTKASSFSFRQMEDQSTRSARPAARPSRLRKSLVTRHFAGPRFFLTEIISCISSTIQDRVVSQGQATVSVLALSARRLAKALTPRWRTMSNSARGVFSLCAITV